MRALPILSLIPLMACLNEGKFVEKATEADCTYRLACGDPATLNFDGWTDVTTCADDVRAEWGARLAGIECDYQKRAAKQCLKALEAQATTCPLEEGAYVVPAVCDQVAVACQEPADTEEDLDSGDDGGDTAE